jgi:hypothetical protein
MMSTSENKIILDDEKMTRKLSIEVRKNQN